jgi:hypothetical protein
MPIDLTSLKKLETLPPSLLAQKIDPDRPLAAIVKVRDGRELPEGLVLRAKIGERIFTVDLLGRDLERLSQDPAVESISLAPAPGLSD